MKLVINKIEPIISGKNYRTVQLLKTLFQDKKRSTEHIYKQIKKEKFDPNHSNVLGRRRSIDDSLIKEIIDETRTKDICIDDVFIKLNSHNIFLNKKQVYNACQHIPSVSCQNAPKIEDNRYEVNEKELKEYINNTKKLLKNKISSNFLYNLDEVGFDSFVDIKRGLVLHNDNNNNKSFFPVKRTSERITLLGVICMDGTEVVPLPIIIQKKTINIDVACQYSNFFYPVFQSNGFMTNDIFYDWFIKFVNYNDNKKKQYGYKGKTVLLMDNYGAHNQKRIEDLCKKNNIVLHFLVPHSSHLTQPLDLGIFHILKNKIKERNKFLDLLKEKSLSQKYDSKIIIEENI